ncbi:MAG TPA: PorT family protein [Bacteroidales bacterium]|jgi:hypothetical protein|nr:PorT family protein [Bacteroidales bacterium]
MPRSIKCVTLLLLLTASCFVSANLNAQSTFLRSRGAIGITYSGLGENDAFHFEPICGAGMYEGKGYYSLGIAYLYPLTKQLDLETGISYGQYKYRFSNASLGPDAPTPYKVTNGVFDIPVTVRWTFLNYFFLNGGISLGIDTGKENHLDSQTGIGAMLGLGVKYDFKKVPVGLFANPYLKIHSLIPLPMEKYHLRTSESGFRFGIVYNMP